MPFHGKVSIYFYIFSKFLSIVTKNFNFYRYRGPAHSKCNLGFQDSRTIPIVFHNLSGYDSHLFIREIAMCFKGRVSLHPQTKEKYISFTKFVEGTDINLRFIDSSNL